MRIALYRCFCGNLGFAGKPGSGLFCTVHGQGFHALAYGARFQFGDGGSLVDQLADVFRYGHHFENADTSLVAASAASQAVRVLAVALGTNLADESLCHDKIHRRGDEERLDAHVDKAYDGGGGVVRVERAEDQVARECGAYGQFRGFAVADFAHHDHVGVLSEQRAQGRGEGEVNLGIDRRLRDAVQLVFDRLFDRGNVELGAADHLQQGVERSRLTATRGAGNQEHPVRLVDFLFAQANLRGGHAQGIETVDNLALVEKTQYEFLSVVGREGRYADVHVLAAVVEMDAAVLRAPLFCDIHARHDLEARKHLRDGTQRQLARDFQHAVLAETHQEGFFARLEMDVGNSGVHRLGNDVVHEPDGGGAGLFVCGVCPVGGHRPFGEGPDPLYNLVFVRLYGLDVGPGGNLQVVDQVKVVDIGQGDRERLGLFVVVDGHRRKTLHEFLRQEPQGGLRGRCFELEGHGGGLLCGIRLGSVDRDEADGDGPQDDLQRGVRVCDDVDGVLGKIAALGDDNLVHVAFFAREYDRTAGVGLERLGGLDLVCEFHFCTFDGLSGSGVGNNDRIAYRNTGIGIVVLETGGKEERQGRKDKNKANAVHLFIMITLLDLGANIHFCGVGRQRRLLRRGKIYVVYDFLQ